MNPFEEHLLDIHDEISIRDEDRKPYTHMFELIRDWLLTEMCSVSAVFKKLFKGTCLFGSYSNRVRIIKPSEFDIFILLDFPFPLSVVLDYNRPGFVHLYLKETLDDLEDDPNYEDVFDTFYDLVDNKYYLKRTSLQLWIHDIIQRVLATRSEPYGYSIKYSKRSVAHNIYVREKWSYIGDKKISIDFVPAIKFGKVSWMHVRRYYPFKNDYFYSFVAVPKSLPIRGRINKNLTFQLVNPIAERDLLWDKQNLKIVYRLLKSLRNCYGLRRLKSYFLTTLFLWEVKRRNPKFWNHSVSYLFAYMLAKLCDYFEDRELPYFWAKGFNILSTLKPEEITEYYQTLNSVWNTLKTYPNQYNLSYDRVCDHFELPSDLE